MRREIEKLCSRSCFSPRLFTYASQALTIPSPQVRGDLAHCSRAASRSSTISWARTSGSGRLSDFFEAFVSQLRDSPTLFATVSLFTAWGSLDLYKFSVRGIR